MTQPLPCGAGHQQRKGANFANTTIIKMFENIMYSGVLRSGETQSEVFSHLQIIEPELYEQAQAPMAGRTKEHNDVPLNTKGEALLAGLVYCGSKLVLTTSGRKRERKDGTIGREVRARYQCHYNVRHPGECDGQSGYGVTKLDGIVDQIIRLQFAKIRAVSRKALMDNQQAREIELAKAKLKIATDQYQRKQCDLQDLQNETLNVIRGTSRLDIDLLNTLVGEAKAALTELEVTMNAAQAELEQ